MTGRRFHLGALLWLTACVGLAAAPATSLVDAARQHDRQAVRALLKQSADVNKPAPDGSTALQWAVQHDDAEMVELLIGAGADVKAVNRYGIASLSIAAINGNARILRLLLDAGAAPDTAMPEGETALMTAARGGNVEALRLLIDRGANVNSRDSSRGQSALMWAAARNNADAVRLLVESGAEVNARSNSVPRIGTRMSESGNTFSAPPPTGFTPLLFAVRAGSIEAVRALLDAGANVNDTLSDGESALVVAAANAHWQLADVLLDRGADPNLDLAGCNAPH